MDKLILFVVLIALTSCYKMPEEDYYSTTPTTNSPLMVPQKSGSDFVPGMKY